jgi:plasmid stabilization system protein ParE
MSENNQPGAAGQSAREESNIDKLKQAAGDMADAAGKTWDKAEDKAEELWDKSSSMAKDAAHAAEKAWDKAEDKAEELWDKAKSGELKEDAKEKLDELKDGASRLWDRIVDKLDGDDDPAKKA